MLEKWKHRLSASREGFRKLSFLPDVRGIKTTIGEMRGIGFPKQPKFNKKALSGAVFVDEKWFEQTIRDKVAWHSGNAMEGTLAGEKIFDEPLVGFVRGDDPIFKDLKRIIGPHHFTPGEIMAWQAKNNNVAPPPDNETGVVSFVLPLTAKTREENALQTQWPSLRWAQTRLLGEIFSQALVREIVAWLMERGVLAVSPDVTPLFEKKKYPRVGWASPWSHRHVAYAAGLGTFGLHDFLITEKGCAHRLGSFVVHAPLSPVRVRQDDIHAHCLHYQGKSCMACARRCPANAIADVGHDKNACSMRVAKSLIHCNRRYHLFIYGCGLCAVNVPCASGIP